MSLGNDARALFAFQRRFVDELEAAGQDCEFGRTDVEDVEWVAFAGAEVDFPVGCTGWRGRWGVEVG